MKTAKEYAQPLADKWIGYVDGFSTDVEEWKEELLADLVAAFQEAMSQEPP